jgi:hypothetical protein
VIPLKLVTPFGLALRAVGLALAALFHWAWLSQPLGWPLASFHLALVLLALARPRDAILVLAGLGPLSTSLATLLHSPRPGWCVLVAMLWAVVTGLLVRPPKPGSVRLRLPAMALAAVIIASAAVAIAGDPLFITGYAGVRGAAAALLAGEWFEWTWPWVPLHLAMFAVLALHLATRIEAVVRTDREFGVRLCSMLVAGHAAAIGIGLIRFLSAAMRENDVLSASARILWTVRYHSQYDINAAGSILVIVACATIGLAAVVRYRLLAFAGLLVALIGVWMTGSRAAVVALAAVLVMKPVLDAVMAAGPRAWRTATMAVGIAAITGAALYAFYPAGRNVPTSVAYESRVIMLRTAWQAGLANPIFGVGIGLLPRRGIEFGSADMERLGGINGTRENAHNQYLQAFAELGLLGVVALAWVVGSVGWLHALRAHADPLLSWTAWGLAASLLTWMLGHPLLVPEAAVVFWLFVGLVAGMSPAPGTPTRGGTTARAAGAVVLTVVVLSVPWRAGQAARAAGLEHQGLGVSETWEREGDVAYRLAGSRFSLFLPASAAIALPLRAAPSDADPAMVEIYLRDILIDRTEITADTWRRVTIRMPDSARAYERVDFVVAGRETSLADGAVIHVGRARPVGELVPTAR